MTRKDEAISIYDPPEPPEPLHPCRYCDQEMEQEWPMCRDSDWICVNPECERSPYYDTEEEQPA